MPAKLHYEVFGLGTPILCIHGFPLDHTIWQPLIPILATNKQVILPDLRGHGYSAGLSVPCSIPEMAGDVISLMDDLQLSQVMLVGQSMGGYVALEIAHQAPHRLSGLALVASHPYADSPQQRQARMEMIVHVQEDGVEKTFSDFPKKLCSEASIQEFTWKIIRSTNAKGIMGSIQAMVERQDRRDVLLFSSFPTAIILGEKDLFITEKVCHRMQKEFINTSFTILPNAAHMLMMEKPLEVAEILQEMMK